MIVNGPAYCFKCDKVVITKLKESSSSEAKFHSVGAEIRDKPYGTDEADKCKTMIKTIQSQPTPKTLLIPLI